MSIVYEQKVEVYCNMNNLSLSAAFLHHTTNEYEGMIHTIPNSPDKRNFAFVANLKLREKRSARRQQYLIEPSQPQPHTNHKPITHHSSSQRRASGVGRSQNGMRQQQQQQQQQHSSSFTHPFFHQIVINNTKHASRQHISG
jgi:hypothetical protein